MGGVMAFFREAIDIRRRCRHALVRGPAGPRCGVRVGPWEWIGRQFGGLFGVSAAVIGERGGVARTAAVVGLPVWQPTAARPSYRFR